MLDFYIVVVRRVFTKTMAIVTNPQARLAKPGTRWRFDPLVTKDNVTALLSHHIRKTGGIGRQLLSNEQAAQELENRLLQRR